MSQRPIKVLVVDDTVVVRRMVTKVLEEVEGIEVVGSAANGVIALQRIEQLKPDVVTLDVEMPEMDGIETLRHLRPRWPHLPVIMFSTLTERGARATFDALALGANDFVTKPSNAASMSVALEEVTKTLVPLIFEWADRRARQSIVTESAVPAARIVPGLKVPERRFVPRQRDTGRQLVDAIAIAVSTGGPNALKEVIPHLPANLRVPVLVVQHMPEVFTRMLAERLDAQSAVHVVEANEGDLIESGTVYIAPGGKHMLPVRSGAVVTAHLTDGPPENSCRPAADVMMRGASAVWGKGVLGVVLTGMGSDGLKGCEQIVAHGGRVIAQDKESSAVWGMPGSVAEAGIADELISITAMAQAMLSRVDQAVSVGVPR